MGTPKQKQTSYYQVYSIFGLRVPDDGTVTSYREIKLKLGFGVVHCCYYDKIYLQLIDMDGPKGLIYSNGSRCKILMYQ